MGSRGRDWAGEVIIREERKMSVAGRVIVYGGRGALGSAIVAHFKAKSWWVANIDMKENDEADANVIVTGQTWTEQEIAVRSAVSEALGVDNKLDAVLCVAGGWAGGAPASKDFVKNADLMWRQSVWSSSIAATIAAHHLREGGVVVLPGRLLPWVEHQEWQATEWPRLQFTNSSKVWPLKAPAFHQTVCLPPSSP